MYTCLFFLITDGFIQADAKSGEQRAESVVTLMNNIS